MKVLRNGMSFPWAAAKKLCALEMKRGRSKKGGSAKRGKGGRLQ